MKCLSPLLLLLIYVSTAAQQPIPAGIANAHILNEADGFAGFNYASIYHSASGKVYSRTYDGELTIHGNNYTKSLNNILQQPSNGGDFLAITNDETWYFDSKQIAIIKGDSLYKLFKLGESNFFIGFGKMVLYITNSSGKVSLQVFNGREIKTIPHKNPIAFSLNSFMMPAANGTLYYYSSTSSQLNIYRVNMQSFELELQRTYPYPGTYIHSITNPHNFIMENNGVFYKIVNGRQSVFDKKTWTFSLFYPPYAIQHYNQNTHRIFNETDSVLSRQPLNFLADQTSNLLAIDKQYGSFYIGSGNKPQRIFTTVKKFPKIFYNQNSASIYSITEDSKGRIWAGSYQGGASIIDNGKLLKIIEPAFLFSNGSSQFNNKQYLSVETNRNGLMQFDMQGNGKSLSKGVFVFCSYVSRDKKYFYAGTGNYNGLWQTATESLDNGKPGWKKIDSSKGIKLLNILTITEDSVGRI